MFNTDVLEEVLAEDFVDFGRDILPTVHQQASGLWLHFRRFWEDIRTIRRFFEVNLRIPRPTHHSTSTMLKRLYSRPVSARLRGP